MISSAERERLRDMLRGMSADQIDELHLLLEEEDDDRVDYNIRQQRQKARALHRAA
ncbi:hypothetical protein GCM10025867_51220 (plasmid) [Frondihabitans sucicola]|uniref:Uncharacterized protein n=1 Tax=Frondihabitans sucicola TaxID=1268041 RepID=A0ABM8GWL1_9MICO|nr:hypothetical protein [Frondihabitans sucicola]BDZ52313.1 hypothetical protein GCM10025867_45540 [Frondihabitans sucicola]BDZ52881.1 hypothetical protein GCM10025867_51220 [Frondihabitans sucicola]